MSGHNQDILTQARELFRTHFGAEPTVAAHAPGRVEVLGNHTDYNEGFVLSAAINLGTFFLAAPSPDSRCRLVAGDLMQEARFDVGAVKPSRRMPWANYCKGVFAGLAEHAEIRQGFRGLFLGNIPLGSGLSSSAALEMSTGLALGELYGIRLDKTALARIGQAAEHHYAGTNCGLLDQISSLCGQKHHLVESDFRSLRIRTVPLGEDSDACFLMCNTNTRHTLVDGEYNERRRTCEKAARFFASALDHPVTALRDVSWKEYTSHAKRMKPIQALRAAHVVGENTRVLKGCRLLKANRLAEFGELMFQSHESSRTNFENSCPELDFVVATARKVPGVLGARLSGGGFGGSAVALVHRRDVDHIGKALSTAFLREFGHACDVRLILPSDGARVVRLA